MSNIIKKGFAILTTSNRNELSHDWGGEFYYSEKESDERCKELNTINGDIFKSVPAALVIAIGE